MNKLAITICLFAGISVYGQTSRIDSLLANYPESKNEERVELLHELVKASWTTEPELAVKYGREAIAISKELEDLKLLSISYRLFGGLYNYMSLIDSGRHYKSEALKIALQLNDSLLICATYNNLGVTSQTVGNYIEALQYYYQSYLIGRNIPEFAGLPVVIANISEVYYDIAQYDSAKKYAQHAVSLTENGSNTPRYLLAMNWLARSNLAQGNIKEAESAYLSIIEIGKEIDEKRYTAYANQGLGRLNMQLANMSDARQYLSEALNLYTQLDDQTYIAETYSDLSKFHEGGSNDSALYYARKSLSIAKKLELNDIILLNYQSLINLFGSNRNFDSLQYYIKKFSELESSREAENNRYGMKGIFAQIQEEQIRGQMAIQSLALEQKTFQTNFFIVLALITLIFAGVIFRFYRKQKKYGLYLSNVNQKIANQNELIDKKNQDLEELNKEKNNLINIVAHDLRNPLTSIIMTSQFVKEELEKKDKKNSKLLGVIEDSGKRLSKMISKILDVDAIEEGSSAMELVPVNLSEILLSNCVAFEDRAKKKKIKIQKNISEGVIVKADQTYVYQVLENLISNAIKFSPANKGIYITLTFNKETALVEVRDEGPGISRSDKPHLFQKFHKLSATPTGGESSTGLGLSIVKKFVESMGGNVWCESEQGRGATFLVEFPLAK